MARALVVLLLVVSAAVGLVAACTGDDPSLAGPAAATDGGVTPPSSQVPPGSSADAMTTLLDAGPIDAAPRACAGKSAPPGFVDFLCADFDGPTVDEGFTTYVPDGGALMAVSDVFVSAPASFVNRNNAQLLWQRAGGGTIAAVDLRFRINVAAPGGVVPPASGSVEILEVGATNARLELRFTRGGFVGGAAYTGYFVNAVYCPSACALVQQKLPNLPPDLWNDVHFAWTKTGLVTIEYGADEQAKFTASAFNATTVSLKLGLVSLSDSPGVSRHAFDDVVLAAKRD